MKQLTIIVLFITAALVGRAADETIVDGVVYRWSNQELGYVVTGWDEATPIQTLHILGSLENGDVVRIDDGAFEDNTSIVFVRIDEGITSIGENAFCRCENMEAIVLPEGLETIEEEAFAFCEKLTTMVIPSTVTEIQAHAFSHCTGVTDVYFLMTDEEQLEAFEWWDGVYEPGNEEHGGMEFNTNQHTTIHVPEGMLQDYVDSKKFVAWIPLVQDDNCYPLWWIVNFGVVGRQYTVCDDLLGVYVDVNGGLYAKDDSKWLMPDRIYPGEIDYMKTTGLMNHHGNKYDQSNWVVLRNVASPELLKNRIIEDGNITGTLINKQNPEIEVTSSLEPAGNANYVPNVYIPCSFMGRAQHGRIDKKTYAFVQPKPQEYIKVEWTVYKEEDEFYIPAPDNDGTNGQGLTGGFKIDYELYGQPDDLPSPEEGKAYSIDAINRHTVAKEELNVPSQLKNYYIEPYTEGGLSANFTVFPLYIPSEPIPTAVSAVTSNVTCSGNHWYTIDGRDLGIATPTHSGIYINKNKKILINK